MTLEVRVNDTITLCETYEEAKIMLVSMLEELHDLDQDTPLCITITKKDNKSPPDLGIKVTEKITIKGTFG